MPYAHLFSSFAAHILALVSSGGYAALFILTLLEGIPVLGTAVPGHVAIILAGFLSRIGDLNLWWVIAISVVGAVLGDYIGFSIGRRYGIAFIDRVRPYFFVTDSHIEKARALLAKHTGKAMIIGRFTPATRALIPFLVGAGETGAGRFWIFNIIGGISWAVVSIMAGYAFGSGYHAAAGFLGRAVVIAIVGAVIIIWGYRFVNSRFHIFRRYELFTLALCLLSLWALAETIEDAWAARSFMAAFDIKVNLLSAHYVTPALASVAAVISDVGGTAVTAGLGVIMGLYMAMKHRWRSAAIALASIGSTGVVVGVMKEFFMRARPANALQVLLNDPSFPSGHAALAAAFFVVLAYLVAPKISSWVRRELMMCACLIAAILIGLSRIALNVHWASDVVAGWALGTFCTTSSILLVRYLSTLVVRKSATR